MPGSLVRYDQASLFRHVAICAAALVAWVARENLHLGNSVLWIFAIAALFNLQFALVSNRPRLGVVVRWLSPVTGLLGWLALMYLTGGGRSPFVAGLSLEILLSAWTTSPSGIALVTAGAISGLLSQEAALGPGGALFAASLSCGFLLVMGGLTAYLAGRWKRTEQDLFRRHEELSSHLETLEDELDEARTLGSLGGGVARLSHGLKNASHSLRGFVGLLEPSVSGSRRDLEVLTGLRAAIDHLEEIARTSLTAPVASTPRAGREGRGTPDTVNEVVRDVGNSFPGIHWSVSLGEGLPPVSASADELREVLTIVVRNAAEAMRGIGEVAVEAAPRGEALEIRIRDRGPGIPESGQSRLFEPGYTTKPDGHGYGLYVARRIVETRGGAVNVSPAPGGGTLCSIELPFLQEATS